MFQAWVKTVWTAKGKRTGAEFLQEGPETDTIMIILPSYLFPINFQRRHTSWVTQYSVFYGISLVAQMVKNLPEVQKTQIRCWVRKIPWRKEWRATPVFLPGEFHRQRSLVGHSPSGLKESIVYIPFLSPQLPVMMTAVLPYWTSLLPLK